VTNLRKIRKPPRTRPAQNKIKAGAKKKRRYHDRGNAKLEREDKSKDYQERIKAGETLPSASLTERGHGIHAGSGTLFQGKGRKRQPPV